MFYGTIVWDPWLILAQIVCLQCLYYLTLGFFMVLLVGTRVSRMSLMYFFDFSMLVASTVTGWCVIVSFILSSLAGAVYLLYLIERAKKCLDFSATLYIIHLFISIIYGGWPSSITWWVFNVVGLALMSLLGEWLCIRREMQEIPITRLRSRMPTIIVGELVSDTCTEEINKESKLYNLEESLLCRNLPIPSRPSLCLMFDSYSILQSIFKILGATTPQQ